MYIYIIIYILYVVCLLARFCTTFDLNTSAANSTVLHAPILCTNHLQFAHFLPLSLFAFTVYSAQHTPASCCSVAIRSPFAVILAFAVNLDAAEL